MAELEQSLPTDDESSPEDTRRQEKPRTRRRVLVWALTVPILITVAFVLVSSALFYRQNVAFTTATRSTDTLASSPELRDAPADEKFFASTDLVQRVERLSTDYLHFSTALAGIQGGTARDKFDLLHGDYMRARAMLSAAGYGRTDPQSLSDLVGEVLRSSAEKCKCASSSWPNVVFFVKGSSSLMPAERQKIVRIAERWQAKSKGKLVVEGFADASGGDAVNGPLSFARADAVVAELRSLVGKDNVLDPIPRGSRGKPAFDGLVDGDPEFLRVAVVREE